MECQYIPYHLLVMDIDHIGSILVTRVLVEILQHTVTLDEATLVEAENSLQ